MSGVVEFSREASCWIYRCSWGCYDFDFESAHEAREALIGHKCFMIS